MTLFPSRATSILRLRIRGATIRYQQLIKAETNSTLFVNYVDGLTQLNGLESRRVVVDTHDVKFAGYNKLWKTGAATLRSLRKFRSEVALLESVKAVIAISPTEAGFYRMVLTRPEVFYVPQFEIVAANQLTNSDADSDLKYDLLFVGSDNPLNVRGITGFWKQEASWLHRYTMAICGNVCQHPIVIEYAAAHPNIKLLGFVKDMVPIYSMSKVAISPVDGTGLKIKIVDALQHGKPVFASQQALDGLPPGFEGCVFRIERQAIERILAEAETRLAVEMAARQYFKSFQQGVDRERLAAFLAASC